MVRVQIAVEVRVRAILEIITPFIFLAKIAKISLWLYHIFGVESSIERWHTAIMIGVRVVAFYETRLALYETECFSKFAIFIVNVFSIVLVFASVTTSFLVHS